MKKLILICGCILSTTIFAKDLSTKKELLADIKTETKKCVVQIVSNDYESDGKKVLGFKSTCPTLTIISETEAHILIEGEWLVAKIIESKESDGGDLDDLIISNSYGKIIAKKTNIPAYNSVLVAMAGDSEFEKREILEKDK